MSIFEAGLSLWSDVTSLYKLTYVIQSKNAGMAFKLHRRIYLVITLIKFEFYFKISIFSQFLEAGLSLWSDVTSLYKLTYVIQSKNAGMSFKFLHMHLLSHDLDQVQIKFQFIVNFLGWA